LHHVSGDACSVKATVAEAHRSRPAARRGGGASLLLAAPESGVVVGARRNRCFVVLDEPE
jgi:hypothetical protein